MQAVEIQRHCTSSQYRVPEGASRYLIIPYSHSSYAYIRPYITQSRDFSDRDMMHDALNSIPTGTKLIIAR